MVNDLRFRERPIRPVIVHRRSIRLLFHSVVNPLSKQRTPYSAHLSYTGILKLSWEHKLRTKNEIMGTAKEPKRYLKAKHRVFGILIGHKLLKTLLRYIE